MSALDGSSAVRLAFPAPTFYMRAHSTHGLWFPAGRNPAATAGGVSRHCPKTSFVRGG
jgi:hypothetical protein